MTSIISVGLIWVSLALFSHTNRHYYDTNRNSPLKVLIIWFQNLPRDIINKRFRALFCLVGSVACRDTSSNMLTLSNITSQYWDNLPRGTWHSKQGSATVSAIIFTLVYYQITSFQIIRFGYVTNNTLIRNWTLAHQSWVVTCSPYSHNLTKEIKTNSKEGII